MADEEKKPASDAEINRVYWEQVQRYPHIVGDETDPNYDPATHPGPTKQRIASAMGPSIGEAVVPMRTKLALHFYRRIAEPLFALAVVEGWPIGLALPDDVMHYLQRACRDFGIVAREEVRRQKPEGLNVETALARAFGLVSGPRKPDAVRRMRTALKATEIAEEYEARRGNEESKVAVLKMAEARGSTAATIWRYISLGRRLLSELE